ncbi:cobalamin-5'-phosphate synthase [Acinetobacter calcoaceticus]|uniref:Adenosylcobinamide-GDP ribazoletransferase n=1 Tax=Acinetobacter calcoaceticus TaxID=471 RepID=A0A4R1XX76_ACICA|nr:cobalamin-5'-phosphate synthase [Acinetobacter calcoaceticus]
MMPFLIALQFLTVIPIQLKRMPTAKENGCSLMFYPVVGALIGALLYAVALLLLPLPNVLSATLILALWIGLTGGLHLDGLADTADAWVGGYGDRQRTLEIMKDPACGPIGVLSLLVICWIKWSALYVLLTQQHYMALILFPIIGRLAPMLLLVSCSYVREKGLGAPISATLHEAGVVLILLMCTASTLFWDWSGVFSLAIALLTVVLMRRAFISRLGGVTGDTLGASVEITEAVALLGFVCLLFYI